VDAVAADVAVADISIEEPTWPQHPEAGRA
jgi:hypothetical protein